MFLEFPSQLDQFLPLNGGSLFGSGLGFLGPARHRVALTPETLG
jgi:hypothetical protein